MRSVKTIHFCLLNIFFCQLLQANDFADSWLDGPNIGEASQEFIVGSYKGNSKSTPLLKDFDVKGWVDETYFEAKVSYRLNGSNRWTGIQGELVKDSDSENSFTANVKYIMQSQNSYCSVPLKIVFKVYEKGFLIKHYQPALVDVEHCFFYNYLWAYSADAYLLRQPTVLAGGNGGDREI